MSRPLSKSRRPNGRHETGGQTVPDINPEESMSSPAPTRKPALPEVLDDLMEMHQRASARAREAAGGLGPLEEQIRSFVSKGDELRSEADELRRKAAEVDMRADNQFQTATELGAQRDQLRVEAATQKARADFHGTLIDTEIALGAEDPAKRRERLAEEARQTGQQVVPQPFPSPSPLDGPNPPLGPSVTHPFPARGDLDMVQVVPVAEGGGS